MSKQQSRAKMTSIYVDMRHITYPRGTVVQTRADGPIGDQEDGLTLSTIRP